MSDLTTMLQNFALTASLKAESLRKHAAETREGLAAVTSFPEMGRTIEFEAKSMETEAAAWTARATKAREGYLLVDVSDVNFQMDDHFRELVSQASSEHRVVYIEPAMDANPLN